MSSGMIEIVTHVTVDDLYTDMTEGQRQHMANKLNKHGYINPQVATKQSNVQLINELRERGTPLSFIAQQYER